ncbi:MAG: apolipoprotein N-acyltransferase, partial [Acidobacteria bacterium]|nr:apolipoprotein N-acyltransferase [Acidobacteriota bacterium]
LLVCGVHGTRMMLFAWALHAVRRNFNLPLAFIAPPLMVSAELCVPSLFQYYVAMALARQPLLIQVADLTGVLGVSALLMLVNGAVYDVLTAPPRRIVVAAAAAAVLVAALAYGHLRIAQVRDLRAAAPKIRVGVVQPNVVSFDEPDGTFSVAAQRRLAALQARSAELEAMGADLILWPESSYKVWISRRSAGDWPESHPSRIGRGFSAPLVINALTYDPPKSSARPYNSALLLDRGNFTARYDKNNLMMFGESIPGAETLPWLKGLVPNASQYMAGEGVTMLPFRDRAGREWRLGPMICLEDILPGFGRQLGRQRPHLLINLTNDAWFGDTSEPWQHLALSIFRSVELRTEMVRAVNTGVSAYVDATGRIYSESYVVDPTQETRGADKFLAEVALLEGGHTAYVAAGESFGYAGTVLTLYLWLIAPRLRRSRASASSQDSAVTSPPDLWASPPAGKG